MKTDHDFMARALRLAELGRYSTQPNPRVGCVIVRDHQIVGEGFHQQSGNSHAEIIALKQAGSAAKNADVFVSLEPCSHHGKTPPCVDALIKAGVKRVCVAMIDPNPSVAGKGILQLEKHDITTNVGLGDVKAKWLNRGFIKRMETGKPFVTVKLATSLDGRVAMKSGESAWITSNEARADVHRLRLENCAIITGIDTVLADDPSMTVRLSQDQLDDQYVNIGRQPVRVVLDSQARLKPGANICNQAGETWQCVSDGMSVSKKHVADRQFSVAYNQGRLDLKALLTYLGEQEMNNVLVEAGGTLAGSFIKAGLVDELIVYQSPDIMGASAQAMLNLPEILSMSDKIQFEYQDLRKIGRDIKLTLTPV